MTFSFDENLADDVSLVRFHIGDTDDAGHFLEDETIQYHIGRWYGWFCSNCVY